MNDPLIILYRQAEDYFFRGISLKCINLGDYANAYMTGGAELNFIYVTKNKAIAFRPVNMICYRVLHLTALLVNSIPGIL